MTAMGESFVVATGDILLIGEGHLIRMFRFLSVAVLAATCLTASALAQTPVERGAYLVNAVMGCDGCHTPRGPGGFDMSKRFSGGSQVFDEPQFTVKGSNITPDRETGIGAWSDADIRKMMTEGVRPNGVPVAQMPYPFYRIMTPGDLDAVVAYMKTIAPVRNDVQPPNYKAALPHDLIPGAERPIGNEVPADPVKRGFYLATLAHCMECHARKPQGGQDYVNWWGKGGHEMKGPFGTVKVANITSHREKGIGAWSDDDIKKALTRGIGRDGRIFKAPMARQVYFSRLTAQDLDALVVWVRTIPPAE
jgi:mono/diheme cytochrome c family protein